MAMLKKILLNFLLLVCYYTTQTLAATHSTPCPKIQVCFTPGQNCTQQITQVIDTAKKSIFVQAYSFTSAPIAKHLVAAKNRGVLVKVILDKSQKTQSYSASRFLLNQHIPVWIDYKPAIAHNKIMIIDSKAVITGSFNFTKAAQTKNAENVLIIHDSVLAKRYMENWQQRQAVSESLNANFVTERPKSSTRHSLFAFKF
jgi:phosphatidylserine/phosphatidylglycerophosphate/cardiolipin synthase-like enzyme